MQWIRVKEVFIAFWRRKVLRWSLKILLLICIILFSSWNVFVRIYQKELSQFASKQIDHHIDADVTFSKIGFSLIHHFPNFTCSFSELAATGHGYFKGDTLLYAPQIRFEVDLWRYFIHNAVDIRSITLVKPEIDIITMSDGSSNLDLVKDVSHTAPDSIGIQIESIHIENGLIRFLDQTRKMEATLRDMYFSGNGDFSSVADDVSCNISIAEVTILRDKKIVLAGNKVDIATEFSFHTLNKEVKIKKAELAIDNFKLKMEGTIGKRPAGIWTDFSISSRGANFKDILSLFPFITLSDLDHITARGNLDFNGTFHGLLAEDASLIPEFNIGLVLDKGYLKVDTLLLPLKNLNVDLTVRNQTGKIEDISIDLKSFRVELGDFPIRGRFKLDGLETPFIDMDLIARIKLDELEKIFPIQKIVVEGLADIEIKALGKLDKNLLKSATDLTQATMPSFSALFRLKNGKFKYRDLPEAYDHIDFQFFAENKTGLPKDGHLEISKLHLQMDDNPVTGFLRLDNFSVPTIKTSLDATLRLDEVKKFYPLEGWETSGEVKLKLEAEGIYDSLKNKFPKVNARLEVVNGSILSPYHSEPIENIHLRADLLNITGLISNTQFQVHQADFSFENETISMKGVVSDFTDFEYDFMLSGKLDIGRLAKVYPIKGLTLSGEIDTNFETKGKLAYLHKKQFEKIVADGHLKISKLMASGSLLPSTITVDEALFDFDPNKIVLKKWKGMFGRTKIEMQGDVFNYMSWVSNSKEMIMADLQVQGDTLHLEQWLSVQAHVSDTSKRKMQVWKIPSQINFTLDTRFGAIKHPDFQVDQFDGEVVVRDGILKLNKVDFQIAGGTFHFSGDYDPTHGSNPVFDFNIEIVQMDIQNAFSRLKILQKIAPAAEHTEGIFSGKYALTGKLSAEMLPINETIKGEGEIRIASAKINGMKLFERMSRATKKQQMNDPHIRDLVIKTSIENNRLTVKPFSTKISGFNTDIEGIQNFSGVLNYLVKIELLLIEKLKIPFHISGTYKDPKVAIGKGHKLPEENKP